MYNLLKRQAEVEILPMAQALGVAVVPYSPTAGGLLTGKYRGGVRPDGSRLAVNAMYQTRYADDDYWRAAEAFAALAAELGHAPATLAVAWAASHPGVTSVILGARSVEQLGETLAAADLALSPEVRARIASLTPEPPPATDRNEERTAHSYGRR
jgi:aryl-alcohol dehydrogenase-like predicted oxidoreductase